MKVNRGGKVTEYRLHQWANDWISADGPNGSEILSPLVVILDADEVRQFKETTDQTHVGIFCLMWDLDEHTGRFTKQSKLRTYALLKQIRDSKQ